MRIQGSRTVLSAAIGFMAIVAGAVWAGQSIGRMTIDNLLRHDVEEVATRWAAFLRAHPDALADFVSGGEISAELETFFRVANLTGRVFRYHLFDPQGRMVLTSDEPGKRSSGARLGQHHDNKTFAASVLAGGMHTQLKAGKTAGNRRHYGEVYVPVMLGDAVKAVVEVYVDQTEQVALLERSQLTVGLGSAGLVFLCLLLPAGCFYAKFRERAKVNAELRRIALEDGQTKLMTRDAFLESLEPKLAAGRSTAEKVALLYIDLDRFKEVNDTLGHVAGDSVLRDVADRMRGTMRKADLLCRLGSDEFAIALMHMKRPDDVASYANRLLDVLAKPYQVGGHECVVGASIGIALAPDDASDGEELLRKADLALHQAKMRGRHQVCWFQPRMTAELLQRRGIEAEFRTAIMEDQFELHYQPYVDLASGEEVGREALLRWQRPGRGLALPSEFLAVAEESGLIAQLCEWTLLRACSQARVWSRPLKVAVNVSPVQFMSHDMPAVVQRALAETGLPAERLEIEITESLLLRQTAEIIRQLENLRALGVSIVLDDFGTGYSSLSYLTAFPYDKIKIDKTFVRDMERDALKKEIIAMVVQLARVLDVAVTAEGVETIQQKEFLLRFDGLLGQGYLFGRAVADPELPLRESAVVPFPQAATA